MKQQHTVVVNHKEQYTIWPADHENMKGWRDAGKIGIGAECRTFVGKRTYARNIQT